MPARFEELARNLKLSEEHGSLMMDERVTVPSALSNYGTPLLRSKAAVGRRKATDGGISRTYLGRSFHE